MIKQAQGLPVWAKAAIAIVAVVVLVGFAKDAIARTVFTGAVGAVTGLQSGVRSVKVGILTTLIGIRDFVVLNPRAYRDRVMVNFGEIYVDYDLGAILKGQIHLEEVRLDLKELTLVKNEKGELNIHSIKALKKSEQKDKAAPAPAKKKQPAKGKGPGLHIDLLLLKVERVVYKDYSKGGSPEIQTFDVRLNERYENVTDLNGLVALIVLRALSNTSLSRIANLDLDSIRGQVFDSLSSMEGLGGVEGAVSKAAEALKKFFPAGE